LQRLKPIHIQKLYDTKLIEGRLDGKSGLNAKSVIGIHRVLRKALNQAYKLQMIIKKPTDCIEYQNLKDTILNYLLMKI
jgi:integrase